jgi:anti-sigma factor RsiW
MSRPISEGDLHAHVDGALPVSRRAEVEAYLAANPEIALRFGRFAEQRDSLRAALDPIATEPVPAHLNLAHLAASRRQSTPWTAWKAAGAACLLLVAGGGGGWALRGLDQAPKSGIQALADEATYAYAVFGNDSSRAVEIPAANSPGLVRWIESRLQRPITMPALDRAGFRLMGGRVVATGNGPAGLLIYSDAQGQRIAILIRPMIKRDHNARMKQHEQGDLVGFSWADDGMGYSMVGNLAAPFLHPLADEARRQLLAKART